MATSSKIVSARTQALIQKWGKRIRATESVLGPMSMERKSALAMSLENTHRRLRAMEATQPAAIGQYKRYALDIVNATVPNLIAYDICSVQPIDNRVGMINYISYEYGSNKAPAQAGQMFASSLNMGQSVESYSSQNVENEILSVTTGAATITGNVQWTPVLPGSLYISVVTASGALLGQDDGNGKIVDANTGTTTNFTAGTINYATGEVSITLKENATGDTSVSYAYNNEDVFVAGNMAPNADGNTSTILQANTKIPEVQLKITSLPVVAQSRKMKAVYAFDAAYELEKEYGQDIDTLMATEVAGEIAHEIDMEIANDIFKMANAGKPITWSKTQPVGVNVLDHYDSFYTKLVEGANTIFGATRKVQPNFIVCGLEVASVIQVMRNFTPSGAMAIGPHFLGTLGAFKVYVSPDYAANQFVLGYKGSSFMDAGYFYCPYKLDCYDSLGCTAA